MSNSSDVPAKVTEPYTERSPPTRTSLAKLARSWPSFVSNRAAAFETVPSPAYAPYPAASTSVLSKLRRRNVSASTVLTKNSRRFNSTIPATSSTSTRSSSRKPWARDLTVAMDLFASTPRMWRWRSLLIAKDPTALSTTFNCLRAVIVMSPPTTRSLTCVYCEKVAPPVK